MKSFVVVSGTVGLDRIRRAGGGDSGWQAGGSATYAAVAAAHAGDGRCAVGMLGVVGEDFPSEVEVRLREAGVDLAGLERRSGATFRWEAAYGEDPDDRQTLNTWPGVQVGGAAEVPEAWKQGPVAALLLGCDDPVKQRHFREAFPNAGFVALDTMRMWIGGGRDALLDLARSVDLFLLNDAEARALVGGGADANAEALAAGVLALGARRVVVKRGSNGALYADGRRMLAVPTVPLAAGELVDPTGAGDAFAGALCAATARAMADGVEMDEAIVGALPAAAAAGADACRYFGAV